MTYSLFIAPSQYQLEKEVFSVWKDQPMYQKSKRLSRRETSTARWAVKYSAHIVNADPEIDYTHPSKTLLPPQNVESMPVVRSYGKYPLEYPFKGILCNTRAFETSVRNVRYVQNHDFPIPTPFYICFVPNLLSSNIADGISHNSSLSCNFPDSGLSAVREITTYSVLLCLQNNRWGGCAKVWSLNPMTRFSHT